MARTSPSTNACIALGRGSIIASAGVATIDDLVALRDLGCAGAIVGRALLDGSMDLRDAIASTERAA